jgi:lipopolysaccharide export system protein LptC
MRDRIAPLAAILLLIIVVGTSYWYSRMMRIPRAAPLPAPGTPDVVVDRVVITQFDVHGIARNKLFAERLTHFQENDNIELASPRLVSLRPDQPQVDARAQRARIENAGERVHMMGSVLLTRAAAPGEPALRISTEYLLAQPDLDRFSTDRAVEMERGASTINAQAMVYDNIARTIDFQGDVRGSFAGVPPAPGAKP